MTARCAELAHAGLACRQKTEILRLRRLLRGIDQGRIVAIGLRAVDPFGNRPPIFENSSFLPASAPPHPFCRLGMRSCTSATNSFGSVIIIAHDLRRSPVWRYFHSSRARDREHRRSIASTEPEADTADLLEAEVDEAIATCGGDVRAALRATLIANAYLEAEVERLTEAISTGFARGRIRKSPTKSRR
jgi:hypothetical protein